MQLRNAAGQVVYETSVTPNDIEDQSRVCLDTGVQSADKNGYTLSITKHAGSKQDMSLWTSTGMSLDSYTGTMTVGNTGKTDGSLYERLSQIAKRAACGLLFLLGRSTEKTTFG